MYLLTIFVSFGNANFVLYQMLPKNTRMSNIEIGELPRLVIWRVKLSGHPNLGFLLFDLLWNIYHIIIS